VLVGVVFSGADALVLAALVLAVVGAVIGLDQRAARRRRRRGAGEAAPAAG
jgi:hypothetical protein